MENEVEYENNFLYEDTADREQQQGECWEYQRVVTKETIEKYVHEQKSVTIGNCHVQKTWTHVGSIEGDEPIDYRHVGVVGFDSNYKNDCTTNEKRRINFF